MDGASSGDRSGVDPHAPTQTSWPASESGLRAAIARREAALFRHTRNSPQSASAVAPHTPPSSKPWQDTASDHLDRALAQLGYDSDIFWMEARSQSLIAVRLRQAVWEWMRNTPLPDGGRLSLVEIGEATGGYDHTSVTQGIKKKERRDAANNSAHKRNL